MKVFISASTGHVSLSAWPADLFTLLTKLKPERFADSNQMRIRGTVQGPVSMTVEKLATGDNEYVFIPAAGSNRDAALAFLAELHQAMADLRYKRVDHPSKLKAKTYLIGKDNRGLRLIAR